MTIRNYKIKNYYGCLIYIRHFVGTNDWEYLTVIRKEIYSAQIQVKQKFFQRLLGLGYSRKEEEGTINYLTNMAMATIDARLGNKPQKIQK